MSKAACSVFYPHRELFTHALGYVGRINTARCCAPASARNLCKTTAPPAKYRQAWYRTLLRKPLHGQVGYQTVEVNNRGRVWCVLSTLPSTAGSGYLPGSRHGYAAARSVSTRHAGVGRLSFSMQITALFLALYSNPGYDPNLFVNGISSADYA